MGGVGGVTAAMHTLAGLALVLFPLLLQRSCSLPLLPGWSGESLGRCEAPSSSGSMCAPYSVPAL